MPAVGFPVTRKDTARQEYEYNMSHKREPSCNFKFPRSHIVLKKQVELNLMIFFM